MSISPIAAVGPASAALRSYSIAAPSKNAPTQPLSLRAPVQPTPRVTPGFAPTRIAAAGTFAKAPITPAAGINTGFDRRPVEQSDPIRAAVQSARSCRQHRP